jgi:hypothetical protein
MVGGHPECHYTSQQQQDSMGLPMLANRWRRHDGTSFAINEVYRVMDYRLSVPYRNGHLRGIFLNAFQWLVLQIKQFVSFESHQKYIN